MPSGSYFLKNDDLLSLDQFIDPCSLDGIKIYEVLRVEDGIPLFSAEHLSRLANSFRLAKQSLWLTSKAIQEKLIQLIEKNKFRKGNAYLYFHITTRGEQHLYFYLYRVKYPHSSQYNEGITCRLQQAERHHPEAKIYNPQVRETANTIIGESHIYETLLVNSQAKITEGSRSNVFFIRNNQVITAGDDKVLSGITRMKALELLSKKPISVINECLPVSELHQVDAAFLTGTTPKILPIKQINAIQLSPRHSILTYLMAAYDELIKDYQKAHLR
jgi:branched-chain amino acid aminotransferase